MDPYLERRWGDVRSGFISATSAALQPLLPKDLRARGDEDLQLEDAVDADGERLFRREAVLVDDSSSRTAVGELTSVKPLVLRFSSMEHRHKWVKIIDVGNADRPVTVIEFLTPAMKAPGGFNRWYRDRLKQHVHAGVNILEIDLLRSSRSRLFVPAEILPKERRADFYTCVNSAGDQDAWTVYPMPLRNPLPTIPISLRPNDADVHLALQPVIDQIYREGGHDDIDYTKPPEPPFGPDDAAWAAECVKAARPV
jgi:hypothetical protein